MEKSTSKSVKTRRYASVIIDGLRRGSKKGLLIIFFSVSLLQPLIPTISQAQHLQEYLLEAGENNPELRAYFSDYLAALEQVPQVGALSDPELSMGIFLKPMERYMGNQQADIQLMQMFPWFGTLGARKDEASKMALAKYEAFQDVKNRLFYEVKVTWYEMYRLNEDIRIMEQNLKILKTYERLALVRYQTTSDAGDPGSGMSEVLRVRIEIKALENDLAFLKDSLRPLTAEFNQLLNRNLNEPIHWADSLEGAALPQERLALLDSITQNNPMLKMLDAEGQAYASQRKAARLEGRPNLGAGVNYMAFSPRAGSGMSMGAMDMVMPMVSVSIPIYRKKHKAKFREAELKQEAVELRRENLANQLRTQWIAALRDLDDANRRTVLYREQSALADQALQLLTTDYSASGHGFEEVLRIRQQSLDYRLNLVAAVVDQYLAVAMLEMLMGNEVMY